MEALSIMRGRVTWCIDWSLLQKYHKSLTEDTHQTLQTCYPWILQNNSSEECISFIWNQHKPLISKSKNEFIQRFWPVHQSASPVNTSIDCEQESESETDKGSWAVAGQRNHNSAFLKHTFETQQHWNLISKRIKVHD